MSIISPIPKYLIERYHNWKATEYEKNKKWFYHLAAEGQHPKTMVISCCDSRVHITSIFGAETGEFFIHRNIANLVPPYAPNEDYHGTSAAIEYAVKNLNVAHIIILGHSNCGGVRMCHNICSNHKENNKGDDEFISQWINILKPGYERIDKSKTADEQINQLEKEGVLISLENLIGFPFVKSAVESGALTIHGLWNDIGEGNVEYYDEKEKKFITLNEH